MAGSSFSLCNSSSILTPTPLSHTTALFFSLLNPPKTSISSISTHLASTANLKQRQPLFLVTAVKKRRRRDARGNGGAELQEVFDFEDDYDDFDNVVDDGEGEGEGEVEDEDEVLLPLLKMQEWLKRKPRGFGEGKVYDTSVEEKLLEEMQQSREAQAANLNKLKNSSDKKVHDKKKDTEVSDCGIRVRLLNLPKKKNIHKDLKAAFKGIPGIINIVPAVSGNRKTRDPVCKGFGFVDFESEEHALRFVHMFSKQSIAFGKIQKQIKCEMVNSHPVNSVDGQSENTFSTKLAATGLQENSQYNSYLDELSSHSREQATDEPNESFTELPVSSSEEILVYDFDSDELSPDSWEQTINESDEPDDKVFAAELERIRENFRSAGLLDLDDDDNDEMTTRSRSESLSSRLSKKSGENKKKAVKKEGDSKLAALGSEENLQHDSDSDELSSDSWDQTVNESDEPDDNHFAAELERIREKFCSAGLLDLDNDEMMTRSGSESSSSKRSKKTGKNKKKAVKKEKDPKLAVPGSAKKLKVKEKAVLTGVLAKYGSKANSASKDKS